MADDDWMDTLPQAARDYLEGRRLDEVECIISDLPGIARGKAVPAGKFARQDRFHLPDSIFYQTITGDWSEAAGDEGFIERDMVLKPDMSTATAAPWTGDWTLQVIHDAYDRSGDPIPYSPRNVLRRVVELYRKQGWRPVDAGTGDEGGFVEGTFSGEWQGDVLYGRNEAVKGHYVLGWSTDPQKASAEKATAPRDQVLLWHMNYHPDGGQLFFPLDRQPFVIPAALPGDNLSPEKVVAFWCDGTRGLYIHAGIWHEGIFPVGDRQRFLDRQGAVHARVSADIGREFGVYLACPLRADRIRDI